MITENTPIEERIEILKTISRMAGGRTLLAGGYVRDAMFMKTPKDIDLFIPGPAGRNERVTADYVIEKAKRILDRFELEPDLEAFERNEDEYGNVDDDSWCCIKSKNDPNSQWGPIDIIYNPWFTGGNRSGFVSNQFYLNICKAYMSSTHEPIVTDACISANITGKEILTSSRYIRKTDAKTFKSRLDRIRVKYPHIKAYWGLTLGIFRELDDRYAEYLREGVIGNPGEVLQEEAQRVTWNEFRFNAGEGFVGARADIVIQDDVQGNEAQVHNPEGVQPRLHDRGGDWRQIQALVRRVQGVLPRGV